MRRFRLPKGRRVWNAPQSRSETRFIYREVFEERCYEQHGVRVADGDVVIDAGANVGLFALSLIERHRDLRLVCVEPAPANRACLERNLRESPHRSRHDVRILDLALGSREGQATLSFYPAMPGNSTLDGAAKREEFAALIGKLQFRDMWRSDRAAALFLAPLYPFWRPLFRAQARRVFASSQSFSCAVRPLSAVLREQGVERVDLLKIDVEGAELDVLDGIEDGHWPLVRQISMEVAPANRPRLDALEAKLRERGFRSFAREGILRSGSPLDLSGPCNYYALR